MLNKNNSSTQRPDYIDIEWCTNHFCNLNCRYCYLSKSVRKDPNRNGPINIHNITSFLDHFGQECNLYFCGGEPFVIPNIIDACREITKNHKVSFFTNLVSNSVRDFADAIPNDRVSAINSSLHYGQLVERNLINKFVTNYNYLLDRGFNMHQVLIVIDPPIIPIFDRIFSEFLSKNILLTPIAYDGFYKLKYYPNAYTTSEINFILNTIEKSVPNKAEHLLREFKLRAGTSGNYLSFKGQYCRAGSHFYHIDLYGNVSRCITDRSKICNISDKKLPENILLDGECTQRLCRCGSVGLGLTQGNPSHKRIDIFSAVRSLLREPVGLLRKLVKK